MAGAFRRDDLYTLFVATRILNFLKGLPLQAPAPLADLTRRSWADRRARTGFELLRNLLESGRLYFSTADGLVENRRFRTEIFLAVLAQAGTIACQNGQRIALDKYSFNSSRFNSSTTDHRQSRSS